MRRHMWASTYADEGQLDFGPGPGFNVCIDVCADKCIDRVEEIGLVALVQRVQPAGMCDDGGVRRASHYHVLAARVLHLHHGDRVAARCLADWEDRNALRLPL